MEKRLVRKQHDRMLFGVASGLADYLNLDPAIVRLIFVILTLAQGPGILLYLILLIIMPEEETVAAKANGFDEEEIVVKEA